jgi:ATP-binding cassette subfamily B protein
VMKNDSLNRQIIRHFWQVSLGERRRLILTCIFIPLYIFCSNTLLPLFIGKILASLSLAPGRAGHYLPYLIISAIAAALANLIGYTAFLNYQPRTIRKLETEAIETLLKRSVGFHNNNIAGKLINDASDYALAFQQLTNTFFTSVIPIAVSLVTGIIVVLFNSWQLGLLVVAMTTGVLWFAAYQTTRNKDRRLERQAARRDMIAQQADVIANSVTVKTFARESSELKEHRRLNGLLAKYRIRDWGKAGSDGSMRIAMLLAFEIAFVTLVIHMVSRNRALLAIGIFTFSYVINLGNRLFDIGTVIRNIEDSLLDASDMMRIINDQPEIVDEIGAKDLQVTKGAISFQAVNFQYQDGSSDGHVFKGLDLVIPAGQKVGLVGPSGGGKSTLSRLVLRFEDIQAGSISIDGHSISEVTQTSLRQSIAYVPQEPLLFHRSVRENIAYGKPGASLNEIKQAADKAYAREFIEALPNGFDTIVGERGVKLSGGQRQRVAIARAILKDAPLILLDEATSALDSESEVAIQTALNELMQGRTTLVIAHRLSTIQRLDRIIVLDNGEIIEDGSHQSLLKDNGLYARLWGHQSGGFIED